MQVLRYRKEFPGIPDVQSGVLPLRRAADSVPGSFTNSRQRVQAAPPGNACALDQARAQRGRDSGAGEGAAGHQANKCGYWPGFTYGVRPPEIDETPISYEEVIHGIANGDLTEWIEP